VSLAVENILGYPVVLGGTAFCIDNVLQQTLSPATSDGCRWLACLNPHSYATALDDRMFAAALHASDWLIPDGAGIVLASRVLGGRIRDRVTGSDVFHGLHERLNELGGYRVFFLGATDDTLAEICRRMAEQYPAIEVAGTYSPPFKPDFSDADNRAMIEAINTARPDVLWVGMSAPKQEKWLYQHCAELDVRFAAAVGAVFDFFTGRVKRSHPAFQRLGLEWLPRLVQEPRRLWRRMGVSAPIFVWHVLRQKLRGEQTR
jgi:N-acetylglucosaminyldiphosphoundecaprenol N-acetyl-beta-D-mannosaminyltransferase